MSIADFFTETIPEFFASAISAEPQTAKASDIEQFEVNVAVEELNSGKNYNQAVQAVRTRYGYSQAKAEAIVQAAQKQLQAPVKKTSATTQNQASKSYSEFAQEKERAATAEGGPPGVAGGGYRTRAKNIIARYSKPEITRAIRSGLRPDETSTSWDESGLLSLANKLWQSGYLPSDAKRLLEQYGPLRYLDEIEVALADMISDAERAGKGSDTGAFLDSMAGKGRRGPVFTAPEFRPTPGEEVQSGFRSVFERLTGSSGTEAERGALAGQFRTQERQEYAGTVAQARAQAEEGKGGVTIDTAPGPQAFAEDRLLDTEEAKVWHLGSLMMDALERMSAGRL